MLGPALGRRSMALNALSLSALGMAVQAPLAIWDVSFQLPLIVLATPLAAGSFGDSG